MAAPFRRGFICGRFQHIHKGHEWLIRTALSNCDRVLVLVGSAQESKTERNPFDYEFRSGLILKAFADEYLGNGRIRIAPLPDMTDEDDIRPEWGRYVLDHVVSEIGQPDFMLYGNDESREGWFAPEDIAGVSRLVMARYQYNISATQMREHLLNNFFHGWVQHVNAEVRKEYTTIREKLLEVPYYAQRNEERRKTIEASVLSGLPNPVQE